MYSESNRFGFILFTGIWLTLAVSLTSYAATLTVRTAGEGDVVVTYLNVAAAPASNYDIPDGTEVILTATADPEYHFTEFSGDITGRYTPRTFTMDSDKSVTAVFVRDIVSPAGSEENLVEMFNRKLRRGTATWGPEYLEDYDTGNPQNSTFIWQPETFMYHDVTTGHEVWKMINTPSSSHTYFSDIGQNAWSADGKYLRIRSTDRPTAAYNNYRGEMYQGQMISRSDGNRLKFIVDGPSRLARGSNGEFWSPQIPDTYYEFGNGWMGATGTPGVLFRTTVTDSGEERVPVLTFPTDSWYWHFSKLFSPDGRKIIGIGPNLTPDPYFNWYYPATIYPDNEAKLDLDEIQYPDQGYPGFRYIGDYGAAPGYPDPNADWIGHAHDKYASGDGSWYFWMTRSGAAWWRIKTIGTHDDGGAFYTGDKWQVTVANQNGAFIQDETLSFSESGAAAKYVSSSGAAITFIVEDYGVMPQDDDRIAGETSGASADLVSVIYKHQFGEVWPENHGAINWHLDISMVSGGFQSEYVVFSPSGARLYTWNPSPPTTSLSVLVRDFNNVPLETDTTITGEISGAVADLINIRIKNQRSPFYNPGGQSYNPTKTNYWSHFVPDRWGRYALYSNSGSWGYEKGVGPGVWDIQNQVHSGYSFGGGAQHHDWHGFADWTVSSIDWPYINQKVAAQKYDDEDSQIVVNSAYTRYDGGGSYNSLVRPSQSPDGTKVAWHSEFLKGTNMVDVFWSVVYYPYSPTDLSANAGNDVEISFLSPKYTERGWPFAVENAQKDAMGWPLLDADGREIGETMYAREIEQYHVWRAQTVNGSWQEIGMVQALYSSTYTAQEDVDQDMFMLHPVDSSGAKIEPTNKITYSDNPGDGTWYYALTSEEHSGLESDGLSEILRVTISGGTVTDSQIVEAKGQRDFWITPPLSPSGFNFAQTGTAGHYRLNWAEPGDGKIRYYNIYYSTSGPTFMDTVLPQNYQQYRIASIPAGHATYLDWLADPAATGYYGIRSVDRYGNESAIVYVDTPIYTITATAGANGSISPSGAVTVNDGGSQTFTVTADTGYSIEDVLVNGVSVGAVTTYDFNDITSNHTIEASFVQVVVSHALTVNSGTGSGTYQDGQVVIITADPPQAGYFFTYWSGDIDNVADVNQSTTTITMSANSTVTANYAINTYTIQSSAGEGGSIDPSGNTIVAYGQDQSYTITADANYTIQDVVVDGVSQGAISEYTFSNVTADHTIHVLFENDLVGLGPVILRVFYDGGSWVYWWTDRAAVGMIEYGLDISYGSSYGWGTAYKIAHGNWLSSTAGSTYHFRVHVKDAAGNETVSRDYMFTKSSDTLHAPQLSRLRSRLINVGQAISIPITATDADGDDVTITVGGLAPFMSFDGSALRINPVSGDEGNYPLHVIATDPYDAYDTEEFVIIIKGEDAAPIIQNMHVTRVTHDSATILWTTDVSANSRIEYGPDNSYGYETLINSGLGSVEDRVGTHYETITGLNPQTTYHYRVVSTDANGQTAYSPDSTFTTLVEEAIIELDSSIATPYILDVEGATYRLTGDITAPRTAFGVAAPNVTLDLNGHTVTYATSPAINVPNAGFEDEISLDWDSSNAPTAVQHRGTYHSPRTLYRGTHSLAFEAHGTGTQTSQYVVLREPLTLSGGYTYQLSMMMYDGVTVWNMSEEDAVFKYIELVDASGNTIIDAAGSEIRTGTTHDTGLGGYYHGMTFRLNEDTDVWIKIGVTGNSLASADREGRRVHIDDIELTPAYYYGVTALLHYSSTRYPDLPVSSALKEGFKVTNGTFVQGEAARGFNCETFNLNGAEISYITSTVYGTDSNNVAAPYGGKMNIHHNIFYNNSGKVSSRHNQTGANISIQRSHGLNFIYKNELYNSPQYSVNISENDDGYGWMGDVYDNYMSNDATVTQCYNIGAYAHDLKVHKNTINTMNGNGIHVVGDNLEVFDNEITTAMKPNQEYGWGVSGKAIELRAAAHCDVYNNNIHAVVTHEHDSMHGIVLRQCGRGNKIHDNTVSATTTLTGSVPRLAFQGIVPDVDALWQDLIAQGYINDSGLIRGAFIWYIGSPEQMALSGNYGEALFDIYWALQAYQYRSSAAFRFYYDASEDALFENNIFASNSIVAYYEEGYCHGVIFKDNTLRKLPETDGGNNFRSFNFGYLSSGEEFNGGIYYDTILENGVDFNDVYLYSNAIGHTYYNVGWSFDVIVRNASAEPVDGATVSISDLNGQEVYSGQTGVDGRLPDRVYLLQFRNDFPVSSVPVPTEYTPHTVTVTAAGYEVSTQGVFIDQTTDLIVALLGTGGQTHAITATAGAGGSINPLGAVEVNEGANQTFQITPDNTGYSISDVLVDNVSQGAVSSYTFNNVTAGHTIEAAFTVEPGDTLPPVITITSPLSGDTIYQPSLTVQGTVTDNVGINQIEFRLNGALIRTIDLSIDNPLEAILNIDFTPAEIERYLTNDSNNTLTIDATDSSGNSSPTTTIDNIELFWIDIGVTYAPVTGIVPVTVSFTATPHGRSIALYEWDFDGKGVYDRRSANNQAAYTYYGLSAYPVRLRITEAGSLGVHKIDIELNLLARAGLSPQVNSIALSPESGLAPLRVVFKASVSDPNNQIIKYEWDFNQDGVYDLCSYDSSRIVRFYDTSGIYFPVLKVTNSGGYTATSDSLSPQQVLVNQPQTAPTINSFSTPQGGPTPQAVSFTVNASSFGNKTIERYEWDFDGDGRIDRISRVANVSYIYRTPGHYTASVKVRDSENICTIAWSQDIYVRPGSVDIFYNRLSGNAPFRFRFSDVFSGNINDLSLCLVDFDGDGKFDRKFDLADPDVSIDNIRRIYREAGKYRIKIKARVGAQAQLYIIYVNVTNQSRIFIKMPEHNQTVGGSAVSVVARLSSELKGNMDYIQFRYRINTGSATGPWQDISPQVTRWPYSVQWDTRGLNGGYDLRAGARVDSSFVPSNIVHVTVDNNQKANDEIRDTDTGSYTKTLTPNDANEIIVSDGAQVNLPSSEMITSDNTLTLRLASSVGVNEESLRDLNDTSVVPLNRYLYVKLSQELPDDFSVYAELTISYTGQDLANAGIDNEENLTLYGYEPGIGWKRLPYSANYPDSNYVSGYSSHFSLFGLGGIFGGSDDGGGGGSSSGGGGGGCFIATAAYGTPLAEEIKVLSKFRDKYLLTSKLGKELVKFYYHRSLPIAEYIRTKPYLKKAVRAMLKPVVWVVEKAMKK